MDRAFNEDLAGDVSVERVVELPLGANEMWVRLTSGEGLSSWLGGAVSISPRPGGGIRLEGTDGEVVWGTVEVVDEPRFIQWSWRTDEGMPTQVEIAIDPADQGCRISVVETLLPWRVSGMPPIDGSPRLSASPLLAA